MRLDAFPVAGNVSYRDTFGDPRSGGRAHAGSDLFAEEGTPVLAAIGGYLTRTDGGLGGRGAVVTQTDGSYCYYAHLSDWEGDYPRRVQAGEVIGYVGATGNAAGGPPHLHFEVHPQGGAAVNPFPLLEERSAVSDVLNWTPGAPAKGVVSKPKKAKSSDSSGGLEGAGLFLILLALSKGWR